MRGVCVNSNGTSTKGLAELNHHVRSEEKEVRDGVKGGGHGLSEEDESRINDDVVANGVRKVLVQQPHQRLLQQSQGPQGSVGCWKRFLPFVSLKVLLVEFDDSTRHIVSALLRNCSYEVTAVANGIEAWEILQDLTNNIDLVLTEVIMPDLSGICLLTKIINHKSCKNIPVIMMSSNDSMGMVFKCLSKGAVDFLVKPIRKNELKNLWQHVWRRRDSYGGSGSESGTRTQKSSKSKSIEGTGNNNVSNDEDDIASICLNDRNGSDKGSGTQSSWTKRAVEVESGPMSPWDELANAPDRPFAQVIHLTPEAFSNNQVPTTAKTELRGSNQLDNLVGDIVMGKDLEIGVPRNSETQMEDQSKEVFLSISKAQERKNLESGIENDVAKLEKDKMKHNGGTSNDKSRKGVADLLGMINCANPPMDRVATESPCEIIKTNIKEGPRGPNEVPSLELSLKRLRDVGEVEDPACGHNVFRRSHLSAFSRYNTVSTANQTPTGNIGSRSPNDNSSEAKKPENLQSNSNRTPNQRSNGSSNNNDVGSFTDNTFAKSACSNKPVPKTPLNTQPCSDFQPPQPLIPRKGDLGTLNTAVAQDNGISSQVQVQHHHHHYHHHHHHLHNMQQQKKAPIEVNASNYSLKESGSGSNNGSNGQNGSSTVICTEVVNICGENISAANFEAGAGWGSGSGSGVDQSRHALRVAALNKFRQKRKERCFAKKVRYQSRKKLAEQRPRVRGQFVSKRKDTES